MKQFIDPFAQPDLKSSGENTAGTINSAINMGIFGLNFTDLSANSELTLQNLQSLSGLALLVAVREWHEPCVFGGFFFFKIFRQKSLPFGPKSAGKNLKKTKGKRVKTWDRFYGRFFFCGDCQGVFISRPLGSSK